MIKIIISFCLFLVPITGGNIKNKNSDRYRGHCLDSHGIFESPGVYWNRENDGVIHLINCNDPRFNELGEK